MSDETKSRKGMYGVSKPGKATLLARQHGISTRSLRRIGVERLAAMSEEAQELMIGLARTNALKQRDGVYEPSTLEKRRQRQRQSERPELARRKELTGALCERLMELAAKARVA